MSDLTEQRWNPLASEADLLAPLRWRKQRRARLNNDLFHENVTEEQIDRVFAVMALCPQHQFLILTKRADRMRGYLEGWDCIGGERKRKACIVAEKQEILGRPQNIIGEWPLPNAWLGVSVENQQTADERIPHLLATPAAVRWISAEPLLGPVNLTKGEPYQQAWLNYLDWVVVGGESGKDARPMHPDWARSLRDQCAAAGVPFNFNQWGDWWPIGWEHHRSVYLLTSDGRIVTKAGASTHRKRMGQGLVEVEKVGKKRAGRLLDGVQHNAFPVALP